MSDHDFDFDDGKTSNESDFDFERDDVRKVNVDFKLVGDESDVTQFQDLMQNFDGIIRHTEFINNNEQLRKLFRPYIATKFSCDMIDETNNAFYWAKEPSELTPFLQHLKSLYDIRSGGRKVIEDNLGLVLNHVDNIRPRFHIDEVKRFEIVLYGHQSTGKSSLINALTGFDISYTAPGQGTKCPVRIHVYRKESGQAEFYYGATIKDENSSPLSEQQMKDRMIRHMNNLKEVVHDVLDIAVYTVNPFIEGVIVDTPGVKSDSIEPVHIAEKNAIFDLLNNILSKNHEHSIFICTEIAAMDASQLSTSFGTTVNHFKNVFPNSLRGLLDRTIVVVNKINFHVNEASRKWKHLNNTGFHNCNTNLTNLINTTYTDLGISKLGKKPIFTGWNYERTFGNYDITAFDNIIKSVLTEVISSEPYFNDIDIGGFTSIKNYVQFKRLAAVEDVLKGVDYVIAKFLKDRRDNRNKSSQFYNKDIFDAVRAGHLRFTEMLSTYSRMYNGPQKSSSVFISIDKDDAPNFALYLLKPLDNRGNRDLFHVLGNAKYKVFGTDLEKNERSLSTAFKNAFESYSSNVLRPESERAGIHEIQTVIARILSEILSFELVSLDSKRCLRQDTNSQDILLDTNPKVSIERQVMEDFLSLAEVILSYLEDTLFWFFEKVVDAILLVDRLEIQFEGINILDVDGSVTQYRLRINMAFKSWVKEIVRSIYLELTQGNANDIFDNFAYNLFSVASLAHLKMFEKIELTAKGSSFETLLGTTKSYASKELLELGNDTNKVNSHIINTFFGTKPNFVYAFDQQNYANEINLDYGKKFFNHLMHNLCMKIYLALQTKILHFANHDEKSKFSLRNKMMAYVFHKVGTPELNLIDETCDEKYSTTKKMVSVSYTLTPLLEQSQADSLKEMYLWDEHYAISDAEIGAKILEKNLKNVFDKHNYFRSCVKHAMGPGKSNRRPNAHSENENTSSANSI